MQYDSSTYPAGCNLFINDTHLFSKMVELGSIYKS
jgi:hypothetical protein